MSSNGVSYTNRGFPAAITPVPGKLGGFDRTNNQPVIGQYHIWEAFGETQVPSPRTKRGQVLGVERRCPLRGLQPGTCSIREDRLTVYQPDTGMLAGCRAIGRATIRARQTSPRLTPYGEVTPMSVKLARAVIRVIRTRRTTPRTCPTLEVLWQEGNLGFREGFPRYLGTDQ